VSPKPGLSNYIAADDPDAAAGTINSIYEKAQLLRNHPRIGYNYDPAAPREVRILLYDHYRITYLVKVKVTLTF
jgi:toxin ParE1/3/4